MPPNAALFWLCVILREPRVLRPGLMDGGCGLCQLRSHSSHPGITAPVIPPQPTPLLSPKSPLQKWIFHLLKPARPRGGFKQAIFTHSWHY